MGKLIKMDFRRMSHSTLLLVSLIVVAGINIVAGLAEPLIMKFFPVAAVKPVLVSDLIANPFSIPLLIILLFMSVVSFSYADFAGGYIKNLSGQVNNRGKLVVSKFIVIGIHNMFFILAGVITRILGALIGIAIGGAIEFDALIPAALLTLLIKWMLLMAISAILLFITTGVRNKTLASIIGVIIGTGALGLVYLGLDAALVNIFKLNGFTISDYMPDQLMSSVSVGSNIAVLNAIIVAVVCTVIFLSLAVKLFKSRDIK
ncbi:MAG: hypothetical protein IJT79_05420 [Ruminococcus sp.]|nr:hypothetical protein [Ruminococcus sp.]